MSLKIYLGSSDSSLNAREGILSWADDNGIGHLWRAQPEFGGVTHGHLDAAHKVFAGQKTRSVMAMLLMSAMTDDEVCDVIADQFESDFPVAAIGMYRSLFWDVSVMCDRDWDALITSLRTREEAHYVALGLRGISRATVSDALSVDSPSIERNFVINQIIARSYEHFRNASDHPNPEMHGAIRWAELALKAMTVGNQIGASINNEALLRSGFSGMFNVQVTQTSHPTLADLQGDVSFPSKKISEDG